MALVMIGFLLVYSFLSLPDHLFSVSYWAANFKRTFTQKNSTEATAGGLDTASKVEYFVTIHSNPVGAEIFVDGKSQGFTPGQFRIEGKKPCHVTLIKDRFLPYEREMIADRDALTYTATMMPLPSAGYLTINVVAGGDNPLIEINGQRLGEKAPVTNYPIPAGVPVLVRARNPFSGTFAEHHFPECFRNSFHLAADRECCRR